MGGGRFGALLACRHRRHAAGTAALVAGIDHSSPLPIRGLWWSWRPRASWRAASSVSLNLGTHAVRYVFMFCCLLLQSIVILQSMHTPYSSTVSSTQAALSIAL